MLDAETRDPGVRAAIEAMNGIRPLARAIGISHVSVIRWKAVPIKYLFRIEDMTGVPRETLRPDLFRMPRPKPAKKKR